MPCTAGTRTVGCDLATGQLLLGVGKSFGFEAIQY